jgi:hypothetical protein
MLSTPATQSRKCVSPIFERALTEILAVWIQKIEPDKAGSRFTGLRAQPGKVRVFVLKCDRLGPFEPRLPCSRSLTYA